MANASPVLDFLGAERGPLDNLPSCAMRVLAEALSLVRGHATPETEAPAAKLSGVPVLPGCHMAPTELRLGYRLATPEDQP